MKNLPHLWKGLILATSLTFMPMIASAATPPSSLFVNLTSNESHRAQMAVAFAQDQLKEGHPITIYLNSQGVFVADMKNHKNFPEQQKILADLIKSGATVIICPHCMMYYGIKKENLLPGIKIGNPKLTGDQLFAEHTVTLSW